MLVLKKSFLWRGGVDRSVRLICARDQHQVANIDDRSDALSCNENRICPIDCIGESDEPADQTHVPKGDRNLTLRLLFRGDPLDHPAAEKQSLAEKSDSQPDRLEAHNETVMNNRHAARKVRICNGSRISSSIKSCGAQSFALLVTCRGTCIAALWSASTARRSNRREM